jgi:sodium-coupled neutral amino acid transporter 11
MAEGGLREFEEDPETRGLLSSSNDPDHSSELHTIKNSPKGEAKANNPKKLTLKTFEAPQLRRTSSLRVPGTPRTPNRVRFNIENGSDTGDAMNGHTRGPSWMDDDDFMEGDEEAALSGRGEMQRMPLLTDIEAPIVTLASEYDFDPEDHLESARPRSNMRSAFMNMANSIMLVGC